MLEKFITFMIVGRKDNEKGATAVEYGLLVALIAAVIITVVILLGTQINTAFTSITDGLGGGGGAATGSTPQRNPGHTAEFPG